MKRKHIDDIVIVNPKKKIKKINKEKELQFIKTTDMSLLVI